MRIEAYGFGKIVIDGVRYGKDVLIVDGDVRSPWRRQAGGHVFATVDLGPLLEEAPDHVVLGTGYFGRVGIPDDTLAAFREAGCAVVVARTGKAVNEINRLLAEGKIVGAGLHLTC
jgi:hypothetical protein